MDDNGTSGKASSSPWKRRWIELGLIFAFWTFLAVLTVGTRILNPRGAYMEQGLALSAIARVFVDYYFWALLTPLIFWISRRFSIDRSNWIARIPLYLGVGLVIAIVADLFSDIIRFYVFPPPSRGDFAFNPLFPILRLWFFNEFITYFAVLAAGFARDYFLRYQARQEETVQLRMQAAQLQAQLTEARLHALRMQINPHFLFNTLHAVSSLVERDPQGVRRMIARLSSLLRYTLEENTEQEVPLRRELEFLHGYLEIQRIRFQGRLDVHQDIHPEVLDALVPNLILQPLVENAIKHGVSRIEDGGRIDVRAWRDGDRLFLSVQDNGPGLSGNGAAPNLERGLGLRNTQARLEGLYGAAHSLTFEAAPTGGLIATISLPYHTGADLRTTAVQAHE